MQTTTPTAAAPKPFKPRSRYRSLEFVLGALLTGVMVLLVLTSGWLFPDGGESMDLAARLMAPFSSAAHPFGTDPLGRDVLARVIVGGKISLMVGFASVLGGALLGIIMGLIAGYYRGFWDMIVMRFAGRAAGAALHPGGDHVHRHPGRRAVQRHLLHDRVAMGAICAPGAGAGPGAA